MAQPFSEPSEPGRIIVTEPPRFDFESYIANYDGISKLNRLVVIGTSSTHLKLEALKAAVAAAKQGKDVQRYMEIAKLLSDAAPEEEAAKVDVAWCNETGQRVKAETDRLESELRGYKNNLIKESIRMGNEDLGAFYYEIGNYAASLKAYNRMREYCTAPKHAAEMSMRLILVAIAQGNWMQVITSVSKIRALTLKPDDSTRIEHVLSPCLGLAHMALGQYAEAATRFLQSDPAFIVPDPTPIARVQVPREILSPNDVAVYGGLCALASMTRAELQAKVLNNADFRNFLELEPHVRRAISSFCASKYTACLDTLAAYRADYQLDLHLQPHVAPLYAAIRRKSIVAYVAPFSAIRLAVMAAAFSTPEPAMEAELAALIAAGALDARIDLVARLLRTAPPALRALQVHQQALDMARRHEQQLRLRLLKIAMLSAGLEVKVPKGTMAVARKSRFDFLS